MAALPSADPALARWIRRQLAADPPRAPSLIVTIWGDWIAPHRDELWLATLFRLLAPFSVNERSVRTGVFRLARSGWFQARAIGRRSRYRLTLAGAEGFDRAFHRVYDLPFMRWDGDWEGITVSATLAAAPHRRLRDELAWAGYGRFGAGLYLRPSRGDGAAERIALALGLVDAVTAFAARDEVDEELPGLGRRAESVWSLGEIAGEYRQFLARFGGIRSALARADAEQAYVARTLLVHAYRRLRLRDPQLPREVLPADWPGAAAYALARTLYRATQVRGERFVRDVLAAAGEPPTERREAPARFAPPV
jgi:phenylacetic acid degradation operon negative regulatory protein